MVSTWVWPRVNMPEPWTLGNQADFGGQGTDLIHAAAVHTLALIQQPAAHHILLQLVEALVDHGALLGIVLIKLGVQASSINGAQALITDILVIGIQGSIGHSSMA